MSRNDKPRGPHRGPSGRPGARDASKAARGGAPPPRRQEESRPAREPSETLYGLRAILAIARKRPADLERITFDPAIERELLPALEAAHGRGAQIEARSPAELQRLAQTTNHEGVVASVRPRRFLPPASLADALASSRGVAIALDRVRNPYNVGAILRTAAFFGIGGVVLGAPAPHPALAPDAVRVAEGGAEDVPLVRTTDLAQTLAQLAARGVAPVGVESDGELELRESARTLPRPMVLVVGHEREGLSPRVRAACTRLVRIAGVSPSFSLNVAIASSIAIAAIAR